MSSLTTRYLSLLGTLLVALLGPLALGSTAHAQVSAPDPVPELFSRVGAYENRIVDLVNLRRTAAGLRPVRVFNGCIDHLSEGLARNIAATGELVHRDQTQILRRCHLHWVGEALVRGTGLTPSVAVAAWMASPPHRAVLMKARAHDAGVGMALDPEGRLVVVLNFGDPT
jgi:uncharacterized protein YkwD